MLGVLDVGPAVVGEDDDAGIGFVEGWVAQETHLVLLGGLVLVAVGFDGGVVIVGEVPLHGGVVVGHEDTHGVLRVAAPEGRGLLQGEGEEEEC